MLTATLLHGDEPMDFTAIGAKDAGLWPQIQVANEGTLLASRYNALVTVFYAAQSPLHAGYPMGATCWNVVEANPR